MEARGASHPIHHTTTVVVPILRGKSAGRLPRSNVGKRAAHARKHRILPQILGKASLRGTLIRRLLCATNQPRAFRFNSPPNLLGSRTLVRYVLSQTHTREEPIQVAYVLPKGPTPNRQLRGFVLKGYGTEGMQN